MSGLCRTKEEAHLCFYFCHWCFDSVLEQTQCPLIEVSRTPTTSTAKTYHPSVYVHRNLNSYGDYRLESSSNICSVICCLARTTLKTFLFSFSCVKLFILRLDLSQTPIFITVIDCYPYLNIKFLIPGK